MTDMWSTATSDGHRQPAPTAELIRQATEQVSRLVRDEFALARTEMTAKGKRAGIGAGMLGMAGVVALFGLAALLVTIGLALDLVLAGWLAALVVAVALLALAGLLALVGRARVRRAGPPMPQAAVRTLREDFDEVKRRAHR